MVLMEAADWSRGLSQIQFSHWGAAQSGAAFLPYCLVIGRGLVHYSAWRDRSCRSHCLVGTHNNTKLHTNERCKQTCWQTVKAPQPAQQRQHVRLLVCWATYKAAQRPWFSPQSFQKHMTRTLRWILSVLQRWPAGLLTWAEVVEVVVASERKVAGECGGVDCGRGWGIRGERKPPME